MFINLIGTVFELFIYLLMTKLTSKYVFAEEMGVLRENAGCLDGGTNFADILSNVLPQPHSLDKNKEKSSDSSVSFTVCKLFSSIVLLILVVFGCFRMEVAKCQNVLQHLQ